MAFQKEIYGICADSTKNIRISHFCNKLLHKGERNQAQAYRNNPHALLGIIHTPYKEPRGIPIQGRFEKGVKGTIRLFSEYRAGLKDIEGFSHLILIYHFNRSKEERLTGKPFLEDTEHGIFAIRSPHRPNHIGFSIVKLESVKGRTIMFSEVDILDGTPLLDIKPYVKHFDSREKIKNGWIDKHFKTGRIPKRNR